MIEELIAHVPLAEAVKISRAVEGADPYEDTASSSEDVNCTSGIENAHDKGSAPEQSAKWVFTGRELLETSVTKPPCLLEPVLQTTGFSLLIGESDIGKTWLVLSLLLGVASRDSEWLGYPMKPLHGRAILIATEDSEYNLSARLHALQQAFPPLDWRDNLQILIADDKSNLDIITEIHKIMAEGPVDLIVADCFGDLFDGRDANSQADARKFYRQFAGLAKQCHFMLVHHKGKRTEDKTPRKNHALGSQAIEGKARTVLDLTEVNGQFFLSVLKCKASRDEKKNSKRLEFDEHLLIFRDTGKTIPKAEIGLEEEPRTDWAPLFEGSASMTRSDLAARFIELTGRGRSAAFDRIKRALENKELFMDKYKHILNPDLSNTPGQSVENLSSPSDSLRDPDGLDNSDEQARVQERLFITT